MIDIGHNSYPLESVGIISCRTDFSLFATLFTTITNDLPSREEDDEWVKRVFTPDQFQRIFVDRLKLTYDEYGFKCFLRNRWLVVHYPSYISLDERINDINRINSQLIN